MRPYLRVGRDQGEALRQGSDRPVVSLRDAIYSYPSSPGRGSCRVGERGWSDGGRLGGRALLLVREPVGPITERATALHACEPSNSNFFLRGITCACLLVKIFFVSDLVFKCKCNVALQYSRFFAGMGAHVRLEDVLVGENAAAESAIGQSCHSSCVRQLSKRRINATRYLILPITGLVCGA